MSYVGTPFQTKRHDTKPFFDRLERETIPGSGVFEAIDLAGATVSFFVGDPETGQLVFGGVASTLVPVLDTDPNVSYTPTATQMVLGNYTSDVMPLTLRAEWQIVYASTLVETIPAGKEYLKVIIGEDID